MNFAPVFGIAVTAAAVFVITVAELDRRGPHVHGIAINHVMLPASPRPYRWTIRRLSDGHKVATGTSRTFFAAELRSHLARSRADARAHAISQHPTSNVEPMCNRRLRAVDDEESA